MAASDLDAAAVVDGGDGSSAAAGGGGGGSRGLPAGMTPPAAGMAGTRRSLKDWEMPSRPSLVPAEKEDSASLIEGRDMRRRRVVSWNKGRSATGVWRVEPERRSSSRLRVVCC